MKTREGLILEAIENLTPEELVSLWNDYAADNNNDGIIYFNTVDTIELMFDSIKAFFAAMSPNQKYTTSEFFMKWNALGFIESTNDIDDWIDMFEIRQYVENGNGSVYIDLEELLSEAFLEFATSKRFKEENVQAFIDACEFDPEEEFEEQLDALRDFIKDNKGEI